MANKIMPPTYFYFGILLTVLMHFIFPVIQIIPYPYTLLGILLIIIGALLNILAWRLFTENNTTQNPFKEPSKFIVKGVYKLSRNPMYMGMALMLLGIAALFGSMASFVFPIIFIVIMDRKFIPLEEKYMHYKFGKKYLEYKNKVRRWI